MKISVIDLSAPISVKDFSATTWVRTLKFGTKLDTGFPRALENLENHKKKFHAYKNHGI